MSPSTLTLYKVHKGWVKVNIDQKVWPLINALSSSHITQSVELVIAKHENVSSANGKLHLEEKAVQPVLRVQRSMWVLWQPAVVFSSVQYFSSSPLQQYSGFYCPASQLVHVESKPAFTRPQSVMSTIEPLDQSFLNTGS